jgi:hypothetical protein
MGAASLSASVPVAQIGAAGLALDVCVAGCALMEVVRRRLRGVLFRVAAGVFQWVLLGAVAPLCVTAMGWVG